MRPRRPVSREELREVLPAQFVFGNAAEDILQPRPFVNAAGFAGGKQGVDHGRPLCGIVIPAEQVVFPALCWQCSYVGIVKKASHIQQDALYNANIMYNCLE